MLPDYTPGASNGRKIHPYYVVYYIRIKQYNSNPFKLRICSNFRHNPISSFILTVSSDWKLGMSSCLFTWLSKWIDRIVGVMVRVLASCEVDRGSELRAGQTIFLFIWCLSAKHATLRSKSKYWLSRNQKYASHCLPARCCFSGFSIIKIKLSELV